MEETKEDLEDVLFRNGFRRCFITACNCGSWHYQGGYKQRLEEVSDILQEAGHPLCNENGHLISSALKALVAERDMLKQLTKD